MPHRRRPDHPPPLRRRRRRDRSGRAALGGPARALAKPHPPHAVRPRRRAHDGEPVVRPLPRLGARRRRPPGRAGLPRRRRACRTRRTPGARTSRAAGSPTPTTPTRAAGSSTTAAAATAGCGAGDNDDFSIGYYRAAGPRLPRRRPSSTGRRSSRYFAAILAETYPNRFYQHAGQTDRLHNTCDDLDAADDLGPPRGRRADAAATTTATCPFLALWGGEVHVDQPARRPSSSRDCAAGHAARTSSYVDPRSSARRPGRPTTTTRTPTSATARRS